MPLNQPYVGTSRKLVLGIDIGTTYSGVSYSILDPGKVPKIQNVTRFPGQEGEDHLRDSKIPAVIWYSNDGKVRAVGAEARSESTEIEAADKKWFLAEWFKLHLRPSDLATKKEQLPKLPKNKTAVQVFVDFLSYIFACAKDHIAEVHPLGTHVLQLSNIEFILTHPNGWEGTQQATMRQIAVLAGLVPDTPEGHERLHLVTEGEASLHYCITNELAADQTKPGKRLVIVDAGGGTVDLSTYRLVSCAPISAVEATVADCLMQGSTYVNTRARRSLQNKLRNSRFNQEEDIRAILDSFESKTKPAFRDTAKASYIRFCGPRDDDEKCGVKRGVLTLAGSEMAAFFDPAVEAIEKSIQKQIEGAGGIVDMVLLVGGFSGSPYLRAKLKAFAQQEGVTLICPEGQSAKPVAEGAISFHLDDVVSARIAKFDHGSPCAVPWIPFLPDHMMRRHKVGLGPSGIPLVPGAFCTILPKGALVQKEETFEATFTHFWDKSKKHIALEVLRYRGVKDDPFWMDDEPEMFKTLCTIRADASSVPRVKKTGRLGPYEVQEIRLLILFGLTELKAQLAWMEDGEEKRSSAEVIHEQQ